jgi:hypothetical protein
MIMIPKFWLWLSLFCSFGFSVFAQANIAHDKRGPRQMQIYELASRLQDKYHLSMCYEDICGSNNEAELDGVFYNTNEYDLSKSDQFEILKKMRNAGVTYKINGSCVVFRSVGFNINTSILTNTISSFTFKGRLLDGFLPDAAEKEGFLSYLAEKEPGIHFETLINMSDRLPRNPEINLSFKSPVTIEKILLSLAAKYGITWHATVSSCPQTSTLSSSTGSFPQTIMKWNKGAMFIAFN